MPRALATLKLVNQAVSVAVSSSRSRNQKYALKSPTSTHAARPTPNARAANSALSSVGTGPSLVVSPTEDTDYEASYSCDGIDCDINH